MVVLSQNWKIIDYERETCYTIKLTCAWKCCKWSSPQESVDFIHKFIHWNSFSERWILINLIGQRRWRTLWFFWPSLWTSVRFLTHKSNRTNRSFSITKTDSWINVFPDFWSCYTSACTYFHKLAFAKVENMVLITVLSVFNELLKLSLKIVVGIRSCSQKPDKQYVGDTIHWATLRKWGYLCFGCYALSWNIIFAIVSHSILNSCCILHVNYSNFQVYSTSMAMLLTMVLSIDLFNIKPTVQV